MNNFSNWDREKDKIRNYEFLGKISLKYTNLHKFQDDMLKEVDDKIRSKGSKQDIYAQDAEDIQEEARKLLYNRVSEHL